MKADSGEEKLRVLMIGPGRSLPSGITALVNTILPLLEKQTGLHYLTTVRNRPLGKSGRFNLHSLGLAISQYVRFLAACIRFNPSVIHLHTSQGIAWLKDSFYVWMARAFGKKIVVHVHAADFSELYEKWPAWLRKYSRSVLQASDAILAVSIGWGSVLKTIAPPERVHVFLNCIAAVDGAGESRHMKKPLLQLLYIGNLGMRKGAFDLIEALGRLDGLACTLETWLAGYEESPGQMDKARDRIAFLGLQEVCHLTGGIDGKRKDELLHQADLFVLPSYHEGLPMSVLEALAQGLPVISTIVGGIPEVVHDGENGLLVSPGDIENLACSIHRLASNLDMRESMGKRSREIASQILNPDLYVQRLVALYRSL